MRKYDSYKDSGIEWIGEIPGHWTIATVGRLTNLGRGRVISAIEIAENEGEYPVYSSQTENNGVMGRLNSFDFEGEYVTWTTDGANAGTVFYREGKFNCTNVCGTIQPKKWEQIDLKFLPYYLNLGTRFSVRLDINPKLMNNMMAKIPLVIPPKPEQTAIAAYLDRKTAEIDELIADKKRLLELYEEEKTAIINQAVTKGINPDAPMKDSGIEWLGEIPEHWETVNLKWVSKIYSGGTPSKNNEDFWQNGTIPWLNSGTVNQFFITEPSEYITEEALNSSSAKWIPENSIVIALAGQGKTKGMAAQVMFECTCNQSMGVIVPNDRIDNRFLLYYLTRNYQNIRNLGGGDKRDGINLEMVGGIPLPVIPLSEQAEIVNHIENHFRHLDAKKAKTEKLIELLTEYRTALISEVVTGKIKVID